MLKYKDGEKTIGPGFWLAERPPVLRYWAYRTYYAPLPRTRFATFQVFRLIALS
jgi:hypothetical protein